MLKSAQEHLETDVLPKTKKSLIKTEQYAKTIEKGHGRIETRECYISADVSWLEDKKKWAGIGGVGLICSKREVIGQKPTFNRSYFIYSMKNSTAKELLAIKRSHWAIENNLHWALDIIFREDECRARTGSAPENLSILRKFALQLIKDEKTITGSIRSKQKRCSFQIQYALLVLGVK